MSHDSEEKLTMFVPPYVTGWVRGPFGEGKVVQIPVEEFGEPDFTVAADDFPTPKSPRP